MKWCAPNRRLPAVSLLRRPRTAVATTAATAAVTSAAATTVASAAAAVALFRFVHAKRTAVEHRAVHALGGLLGLLARTHHHECKTSRAPRLTIHDELHFGHFAELRKRGPERVFRGAERQIA